MGEYKPYYDNQRPWLRVSGFQATSTAIQNPFTFYYVQNNDWSSSHSYQFWNKNFTAATGINNTATLKTIYDPSLSGYCLPKTAAFTNFTSTGGNTGNVEQFNVSGNYSKGWHFYTNGWKTGNTIFFAALGYRDTYGGSYNGTGDVMNVGGNGDYWTVGATATAYSRFLGLFPDYVYAQNVNNRSYGFNVRSVKE